MEMAISNETKKWAEPRDWDQMKPAIKRLYLDQGMKLKDVIAEMEKSNFKATYALTNCRDHSVE